MEDTKLPVEETPVVETTVEVKPKKKVSGCLVAFLVFLGILLLLIAGAYLGYRKISKDLKTQVDLGVKYTSEDALDLDSLVKITSDNYFEVKDGIDLSLTSAQVTAMLDAQPEGPTFSNTQVKFNKDNIEISTLAKFEFVDGKPFNLPLYISANADTFTRESFKLDIQEIKIGLLKLPAWIQEKVSDIEEEWLEGVVLENITAFDFESIRFTNDRVDIQRILLDELR